jgi:flagellar biosynthetic protein FliP
MKRLVALLALAALMFLPAFVFAQAVPDPVPATDGASMSMSVDLAGDDGSLVPVLKIAFMLMVLTLLPAILVSVTSFTRILVVLGFLKQALGTQTLPPSQVIVGLSLFLCLFTMSPVLTQIYEVAWLPYSAGELTDMQALQLGLEPLRAFMANHTRAEDLRLFLSLTNDTRPESFTDVSTFTLVPAFMLSELRAAFIMGALIYLPFIIIDMVVASVLMAMGMMMVPPVMVSLPIKLILFVLADGWNLVVGSLVRSIVVGA